MPHLAGHLIAAIGPLEAEAVLGFEKGEPVGVKLDKPKRGSLAIQHGSCCIFSLKLLHLRADYRFGNSANTFAAVGIVP